MFLYHIITQKNLYLYKSSYLYQQQEKRILFKLPTGPACDGDHCSIDVRKFQETKKTQEIKEVKEVKELQKTRDKLSNLKTKISLNINMLKPNINITQKILKKDTKETIIKRFNTIERRATIPMIKNLLSKANALSQEDQADPHIKKLKQWAHYWISKNDQMEQDQKIRQNVFYDLKGMNNMSDYDKLKMANEVVSLNKYQKKTEINTQKNTTLYPTPREAQDL